MSKHQLDPAKLAALQKIRDQTAGTDSGTQRGRLRIGFQHFPFISTAEARAGLDILHPAARIQELRAEGHKIQTLWTVVVYEGGDQHRVANYLWQRGAQ